MTSIEIRNLVLRSIEQVNLARRPEARLALGEDAVIFGDGSPLDSLGLVALLIDIEEALHEHGHTVTLSDARAMSQSRSPFRSVPALVAFIQESVRPAS
jgi:hypothetical protein